MERKLYRLPDEGKIAGVAAGLAEYVAVDVTLMRLIFVALALFSGGTIILIYIVLAIVLPVANEPSKHENVGEKVEKLADEMKTSGRAKRAGNYLGIGLILFGAWLLIGQLFPVWFSLQWQLLWPLIVILLGVWILARGKRS